MNELNWRPAEDDPANEAGCDFMDRTRHFDMDHWLVRQAFWCGVKWARENRSLPISGRVLEDGTIEWREKP